MPNAGGRGGAKSPLGSRMCRGDGASETLQPPDNLLTEKDQESKRSEKARRASLAAKNSKKPKGVDPTTTDIDYQKDELEFMLAMQRYKEEFHRPFPTWKEALTVLKKLGYQKVAQDDAGIAEAS